MRPADRFRAGSIMKPFIAVVVLQLAEERRLSLDTRLPKLLPVKVVRRFRDSAQISVRMLLDHRSGIPEWDTHPRHRRPDRASSREDLDDPRETRPRGRPSAGIRPRHKLQVLEHRLQPARADHRAG